MKRCLVPFVTLVVAALAGALEAADPGSNRWTAERAWAWHASQPWLAGCNFLPSTAVNDVEMWQKESFDPQTIDRELGWARDLGFNTVRVFVNHAVWETNAAGLKENMRRFFDIAAKHGISTLVILFDDCFKPEPRPGKQPDPEPGVHNSQWVQSPGASRRDNPAAWPGLERYVKDIVGAFAADSRVLAWELYNEPSASLPLVEAAFGWAREARPSQPVTTTLFGSPAMRQRISELSDVICFHHYGPLPDLKAETARLLAAGRPVLCTEWMARSAGSRFETHLPFFKERKIACWNWGLAAGRTQTYFPWGSPGGAPEPALWFHDILRADGTPFKAREVQFIKTLTGRLPAGNAPRRIVLAPAAMTAPVPWRYTLDKPAAGWFQPGFDDSAWKQGNAPFGTEEASIARKPATVWTNGELWLRREFQMPPGAFTDLALVMHHDEDTEVCINGVLAVKAPGYNAAYEDFDLAPEAAAALRPGANVFAAHCRQTVGGQYLDLGLEGSPAIQPQPAARWDQFRGPNGQGVAAAGQIPVQFGPGSNVLWKTAIAQGHSSPVVWGERLFLTAAEGAKDSDLVTLALSRDTGRVLWRQTVRPEKRGSFHQLNNPASSTPAVDERHVYAYFGTWGLVCYDHAGKEIWQRKLPVPGSKYGPASSPILHRETVILALDGDTGSSRLMALDRDTGKTVWEQPRPLFKAGWSTPMIFRHGNAEELVLLGAKRLTSYNPSTGEELWWAGGFPDETVGVPVAGEGLLFAGAAALGGRGDESWDGAAAWKLAVAEFDRNHDNQIQREEMTEGFAFVQRPDLPKDNPGYAMPVHDMDALLRMFDRDKNRVITEAEWMATMTGYAASSHPKLAAFRPGATQDARKTHLAWEIQKGVPEAPSILFLQGRLFLIRDGGLLTCLKAATGSELFRERIGAAGQYIASPVAAAGRLLVASVPGVVTVIEAGDQLKVLARNPFNEQIFATPALADNKIYLRTAGHIYALGE